MSDIEGMYTADPKKNQNARFIHTVVEIDESLKQWQEVLQVILGPEV